MVEGRRYRHQKDKEHAEYARGKLRHKQDEEEDRRHLGESVSEIMI